MNAALSKIFRDVFEGKFLVLLISIMLYLALVPLFGGFATLRLLMDIFFTAILLSGIYAVSSTRHQAVVTTLLALPLLLSVWAAPYITNPTVELVGHGFGTLFFSYTVITILAYIYREKTVTINVIYAAIVVYLLIGIMWAGIFKILETLLPGSLSLAQSSVNKNELDFTYYSFVTLTTLGYGDITPQNDQARAFAIIEAIIGQIYLTVLVARLVGLQISQSQNE